MSAVPCPGCRVRLAPRGERCAACARAARRDPPGRQAPAGLAARLVRGAPPPGLGHANPPPRRVAASTWRPRFELRVDAQEAAGTKPGQGPRQPVPCPACGLRLAPFGQRCAACARDARFAPRPAPAPAGPSARLVTSPAPRGAVDGEAPVSLPRVQPSAWQPRRALWVDPAPEPAPLGQGPRRPVPCAVCGRCLATHGERCAACAGAARRKAPRPAAEARLAPGHAPRGPGRARLAPGLAPRGLGHSHAPLERVAPSAWRPRFELRLDAPAGARVGEGPPRPVPCPACGLRLAPHGQRCPACAREARRGPTPAPAPAGEAPRLFVPAPPRGLLGEPHLDLPRVRPSAWRPRHALYIEGPARLRVERDRRHRILLRPSAAGDSAPGQPSP